MTIVPPLRRSTVRAVLALALGLLSVPPAPFLRQPAASSLQLRSAASTVRLSPSSGPPAPASVGVSARRSPVPPHAASSPSMAAIRSSATWDRSAGPTAAPARRGWLARPIHVGAWRDHCSWPLRPGAARQLDGQPRYAGGNPAVSAIEGMAANGTARSRPVPGSAARAPGPCRSAFGSPDGLGPASYYWLVDVD